MKILTDDLQKQIISKINYLKYNPNSVGGPIFDDYVEICQYSLNGTLDPNLPKTIKEEWLPGVIIGLDHFSITILVMCFIQKIEYKTFCLPLYDECKSWKFLQDSNFGSCLPDKQIIVKSLLSINAGAGINND